MMKIPMTDGDVVAMPTSGGLTEYFSEEEAVLAERQACLEIVDYYRSIHVPKVTSRRKTTTTINTASASAAEEGDSDDVDTLPIIMQALFDNVAERIAAGRHLTEEERANLYESQDMIMCWDCDHRMHVPTKCAAWVLPDGTGTGTGTAIGYPSRSLARSLALTLSGDHKTVRCRCDYEAEREDQSTRTGTETTGD